MTIWKKIAAANQEALLLADQAIAGCKKAEELFDRALLSYKQGLNEGFLHGIDVAIKRYIVTGSILKRFDQFMKSLVSANLNKEEEAQLTEKEKLINDAIDSDNKKKDTAASNMGAVHASIDTQAGNSMHMPLVKEVEYKLSSAETWRSIVTRFGPTKKDTAQPSATPAKLVEKMPNFNKKPNAEDVDIVHEKQVLPPPPPADSIRHSAREAARLAASACANFKNAAKNYTPN